MASINFNMSAEVALMTLNKINDNLFTVQDQISTGKKIATAKDNSAVWAISTTMESDVMGFKQITDSLNLGSSTVEVARAASEQITTLLQDIKALVVSAQEDNVDRVVIQEDVDALRQQIIDIVDAAQFNGLNLIKGSTASPVTVLSSLDRDETGVVTPKYINVDKQNLEVVDGTFGAVAAIATQGALGGTATLAGDGTATAADGETITLTFTAGDVVTAGDSYRLYYNGTELDYIARAGDTVNDIINGLNDRLQAQIAITGDNIDVVRTLSSDLAADDAVFTITNNTGGAISIDAQTQSAGTAGGGLGDLFTLSVANATDAGAALGTIETLISTSISASASFGSAQNRIDIQSNFIDSLVVSLESGISSLTDANLEQASARLQALQVQQQLTIQALSIANTAPQALLALFQ